MEPECDCAEASDSDLFATLTSPLSSTSKYMICRVFRPDRKSAAHTLPCPSIHTRRSKGGGEKSIALIAPGPLSTSGRLDGEMSSEASFTGIGIGPLSSFKIVSMENTVIYPDSEATAQYALDGDQAVAKYPMT